MERERENWVDECVCVGQQWVKFSILTPPPTYLPTYNYKLTLNPNIKKSNYGLIDINMGMVINLNPLNHSYSRSQSIFFFVSFRLDRFFFYEEEEKTILTKTWVDTKLKREVVQKIKRARLNYILIFSIIIST